MKRVKKEDYTKYWDWLDNGQKWNHRLVPSYYDTCNTNWEMYNGNQWLNADGLSDEFPQPVFNLIKRTISFFIASMTSQAVTGQYETLLMRDDDYEDLDAMTARIATASFKNFCERVKIDTLAKDLLLDAAITGDMAVHLYFDPMKKPYGNMFPDVLGQIELETIDGVNLYFGNPNSRDVQSQPYILIYGRDTVDNIKNEIKFHQKLKKFEGEIAPDYENEDQLSEAGKNELDSDEYGKVGYVICYKKMTKGDKTYIYASKSLIDRVIYEDVKLPLERYPVAFNNWERQKNQYHGRALCTDIVPNQIFINRMFAMAMYHLQMTAFPKAVFDQNKIAGWSNSVGTAIAIDREPNENIFNIAGYLQPSVMSPQIIELINMTIKYTKEMLGANDALLGDINPEQASGAAISVTAKQSGIPLEGPKANLGDLFEDMMLIYADMAGSYYGTRPVVAEFPEIGKQIVDFDFSKLKTMQYNVKTSVGATTFFDENAQQASLDNMLASGQIDFVTYLEQSRDNIVNDKPGLITKVKEKQEQIPPLEPPIM